MISKIRLIKILTYFAFATFLLSPAHCRAVDQPEFPIRTELTKHSECEINAICADLNIDIQSGNFVYANTATEVGLPMQVRLNKAQSNNVRRIRVEYPTPTIKIESLGEKKLRIPVYYNQAKILLVIYPISPELNADLALDFEAGICGDGCRMLQTTLPPMKISAARDVQRDLLSDSFLVIILAAILGGFILNFMPCVLPVLSLKILGFVKYSGMSRIQIVLNLLFVASGIFFVFTVLAGFTAGFKIAGHTLGWGVHFQNPFFLSFLIMIMVLLILNHMGCYEIRLPSNVNTKLNDMNFRSEYLNSFASGVLMTVLATPCTAPFLTTAVTFALSQHSILFIFFIYFAVALGMSIPYLASAAAPSMFLLLPKPGKWMVTMKKCLVIPMITTVMWLLYLLYRQIHLTLFVISGLGILISLWIIINFISGRSLLDMKKFLWPHTLMKKWVQRLGQAQSVFLSVGIVVSVLICGWATFSFAKFNGTRQYSKEHKHAIWIDFDPYVIQGYVRDKRIVFVNVTADWCVTCKINETLVLENEEMLKKLEKFDVVLMRADYTDKNDNIENYMKEGKHYAVPLNVVYGPGIEDGLVLPEVLTQEKLIKAIQLASLVER